MLLTPQREQEKIFKTPLTRAPQSPSTFTCDREFEDWTQNKALGVCGSTGCDRKSDGFSPVAQLPPPPFFFLISCSSVYL